MHTSLFIHFPEKKNLHDLSDFIGQTLNLGRLKKTEVKRSRVEFLDDVEMQA